MSARRWARRCALQALYPCELGGMEPAAARTAFEETYADALAHADQAWFTRLVNGVVTHQAELDTALAPCLDRPLANLDPVVRVLLRMGLYELRYCPEVPWKAAVDEAIELAREFGNDNAYRFVNAVLDCAHVANAGPTP